MAAFECRARAGSVNDVIGITALRVIVFLFIFSDRSGKGSASPWDQMELSKTWTQLSFSFSLWH